MFYGDFIVHDVRVIVTVVVAVIVAVVVGKEHIGIVADVGGWFGFWYM